MKVKDKKNGWVDILKVKYLQRQIIHTLYDKIVTDSVTVFCDCDLLGDGRINLFNKTLTPNEWMLVPNFPESFKRLQEHYSVDKKFTKKVIKKFIKKLSDENKLLLEVI